jgi:mannose-1-phosphate guanylyltransferase
LFITKNTWKGEEMKEPIVAILAGGLGTRLRPLTYKVPKPLIRINKKAFLSYLLSKLSSLGVKDVVLLVGYKAEKVRSYCGDGRKFGLKIYYSEEKEPLGTGGALLNAFPSSNRPVLLLNGDSYFDLDLKNFIKFHKKKQALATIYAMEGDLTDRGALVLEKNGRVKEFLEKQKSGFGLFNVGAYLFDPKGIKEIHSLVGCPVIRFSKIKYSYKIKRKNNLFV